MSGEPDFQDYLDEAEDQIGGCHECHPHQRIRLMSELLELAERCEQATGPDRKLDYAIVKAVGYSDDRPYTEGDGWRMPLSFTASLDAAMTLVPGDISDIDMRHDRLKGRCRVALTGKSSLVDDIGRAATPALALCAAALRARAATPSSNTQEIEP